MTRLEAGAAATATGVTPTDTTAVTGEEIPGLRESVLYETSIATYQRHHGGEAGRCERCGCLWPCPPRCHAAGVIAAAGEDPRRHDAPSPSDLQQAAEPTGAPAAKEQPVVQVLSANAVGYPLGGAGRPPVPQFQWER